MTGSASGPGNGAGRRRLRHVRGELAVVTAYVAAAALGAWGCARFTTLPTLVAVLGGAVAGVVAALVANAGLVVLWQLVRPRDDDE